MIGKHPAAVELGRLGGAVKSEVKTTAARANAAKLRPNRARWRALDLLHAWVYQEASYRLALRQTSRRDSSAVRAFWLQHSRLPY